MVAIGKKHAPATTNRVLKISFVPVPNFEAILYSWTLDKVDIDG